MIYLSCIVVYKHYDNGCDGTCNRYCDGTCDRVANEVIIKTWYIYSDATIWDMSVGEFVCENSQPYHQRIA